MSVRPHSNIVFITTGLARGGAENSLLQLIKLIVDRPGKQVETLHVISLQDGGDYESELGAMGVSLTCLNLQKVRHWLFGPFLLLATLWRARPDVIVTWMYHANIIGGLMALLVPGKIRILWNVRHSTISSRDLKFLTRLLVKLGAHLSHWLPESVTFNSYRSAGIHVAAGYSLANARVIHNGFNTERFQSNISARNRVRGELHIEETHKVVGILGRYDPIKDHGSFFEAIAQIMKTDADVFVIAAGTAVDTENASINEILGRLGIANRVRLLGKRDDVADLLNAMDILCLSSFSESFPRVLGEALACEVPCVSTDVGEARSILGTYSNNDLLNCGGVVVADGTELTKGLQKLLNMSPAQRRAMGAAGRARICELFSEERAIEKFVATIFG